MGIPISENIAFIQLYLLFFPPEQHTTRGYAVVAYFHLNMFIYHSIRQ